MFRRPYYYIVPIIGILGGFCYLYHDRQKKLRMRDMMKTLIGQEFRSNGSIPQVYCSVPNGLYNFTFNSSNQYGKTNNEFYGKIKSQQIEGDCHFKHRDFDGKHQYTVHGHFSNGKFTGTIQYWFSGWPHDAPRSYERRYEKGKPV